MFFLYTHKDLDNLNIRYAKFAPVNLTQIDKLILLNKKSKKKEFLFEKIIN
jgi:hypothetical protein